MIFMVNMKSSLLPILACLTLIFSGCSTIKSYFPDKEKDYQFRTEIPELVIPEDLGQHSIEKPATIEVPPIPSASQNIDDDDKSDTVEMERVEYDDGSSRLRLFETFGKAWRIVGKSLTRKSVEIVARDKTQGLFIVQFDPDEEKVTDDSLWDEVLFIFSPRGGNEQEYKVKLSPYDTFTELAVQDENDVADNPKGLRLLTLIQDAIESNLANEPVESEPLEEVLPDNN